MPFFPYDGHHQRQQSCRLSLHPPCRVPVPMLHSIAWPAGAIQVCSNYMSVELGPPLQNFC